MYKNKNFKRQWCLDFLFCWLALPRELWVGDWAGFILVQLKGPERSRESDFGSTARAGVTTGQCSTGQPWVPVPQRL